MVKGKTSTNTCEKRGTEGSIVKFMVSIAFGKGVIGVHQYQGNINGEKYAQIVREKFQDLFEKSANPKGRYFIQDNVLSKNSLFPNQTFEQGKALLFIITSRSQDLNPIENIFQLASKQIRLDAKKQGIKKEKLSTIFSQRQKGFTRFPIRFY